MYFFNLIHYFLILFIHKKKIAENVRSVIFENPDPVITAGLTALAERKESCSILNNINIPTLILCGREDMVSPLAQSEFMHTHIKWSVLKIIDQACHVSNLEQPDAFNKNIVEFFNS